MEKNYETLLFEQDIIRVLIKHKLLPDKLMPATVTIHITGGSQPIITLISKVRTDKEQEEFDNTQGFEKEMFDEDDEPDDDLPDFDFKSRM